jgi:hypothetical protein
LETARKAADDLITFGNRFKKMDEKMQYFALKEQVENELKTTYAPLKQQIELE